MENNQTVKTGRKEKWSPALAAKLISYIADGLNYQQACQAIGICPNTLRRWRRDREGFDAKIEAAREILRAKILAKIKAAGAKDWRAWAEFLRLSFAEYRFGNGPSVHVAVQQNLEVSDPQRAELIQRRAKALEARASEPSRPTDASDARTIALETEARLKQGVVEVHDPEPKRLRERPPTTIIERADLLEERQWREAARRDETDEILGD
jgi:transposase-like protein